ncbi:MAG: hypothetical protein CVT94_19325 [Bacteroidetes bacterium HGW-Bacteroidetes-11]|jgi:hypothetical protein|nr:MAG: hypothetical protein CVT94_19325 [Bacteroidetes bacterium HGW-Bacteroidetes-11]
MAISRKGLAGLLSGTIGNVVVYEMNGKMVVRSRPSVKRKKAKGQQKQTQVLFAQVMKAMQIAKPFLRIGFANQNGHSAFHSAMSANMLRMKTEVQFSYEKLIFSAGNGFECPGISLAIIPGNKLQIQWLGTEAGGEEFREETSAIFVFNETQQHCEYGLNCGKRSSMEASLQLKNARPGDKIHVYLAFLEYNNMLFAQKFSITQSVWVGSILFQPEISAD